MVGGMIAARWMIASGATSETSCAVRSALVRSAHWTVTPGGSVSAALRLEGVSRSATTVRRPSSANLRTVAEPTSPKPPVTSTGPVIYLT